MEAKPVSIFSKLGAWDILDRLSGLRLDPITEGHGLPEGTVVALLAALKAKLPEVAPDIDEMPAGRPTPEALETILRAGEAALHARADYLAAAA